MKRFRTADPVFRYEGHEFVKNTVKLHPKGKRDVVDRYACRFIKDELEYYKGALEAVERKLSDPKFRELAPDKVVALNEKRRQCIKGKIAELEGQ